MSDSQDLRIHPPTPRRRQQARQDGRVARSRDLVAAGVLLCGLGAVWYRGGEIVLLLRETAVNQFSTAAWMQADINFAAGLGQTVLQQLAAVLLPLLGILLLAAIVSQVGQFGLLFLPNKAMPDLARIDPLAGWQRLWGMENWTRIGLSVLKLLVVLSVAGLSVWAMRRQILTLGLGDLQATVAGSVQILSTIALRIVLALVALAGLDYGYQRWRHERGLWMTQDEMREEMRDAQADPQVDRRRRQLQQQLQQDQVGRDIPEADVVITAGASLAIALKYSPETMAAPLTLAKGIGHSATEIYRVAQRHGIWIVDDRKLARELYRRLSPGQPLPREMYPVVAARLAELPKFRGL